MKKMIMRMPLGPKIALAVGVPLLLFLVTWGLMRPVTRVAGLGRYGLGIRPHELEWSWWIWLIAAVIGVLWEIVLWGEPEDKGDLQQPLDTGSTH